VCAAAAAQNTTAKKPPPASAQKGAQVFKKYCTTCHGAKADGTGPAARLYNPPPANLMLSTRPDEYQEAIIYRGGGAVGRSASMPPWGQELSQQQIRDVVRYLGTVKARKP
jgi:mono/diheme cytochrome c family protein